MKILRSFNTAHEAVQWMNANRIEGTYVEMTPTLKSVGYRGSNLSNGNYHVVLKSEDTPQVQAHPSREEYTDGGFTESDLAFIVKSVVVEVMDALKAGPAIELNREAKDRRADAETDMSLSRRDLWHLSDDAQAQASAVHEILSNPDHPVHQELLGKRPNDPVRQERVRMLLGEIADRFSDAHDFAYDRADMGDY